jgi:hypothetical protein
MCKLFFYSVRLFVLRFLKTPAAVFQYIRAHHRSITSECTQKSRGASEKKEKMMISVVIHYRSVLLNVNPKESTRETLFKFYEFHRHLKLLQDLRIWNAERRVRADVTHAH